MLIKRDGWEAMDLIWLPVALMLWPTVCLNYWLRSRHVLPDEWYWADRWMACRGYFVVQFSFWRSWTE